MAAQGVDRQAARLLAVDTDGKMRHMARGELASHALSEGGYRSHEFGDSLLIEQLLQGSGVRRVADNPADPRVGSIDPKARIMR